MAGQKFTTLPFYFICLSFLTLGFCSKLHAHIDMEKTHLTVERLKTVNFKALPTGASFHLNDEKSLTVIDNGRFFELKKPNGNRFSPNNKDDITYLIQNLGLSETEANLFLTRIKADNQNFAGKPEGISPNPNEMSISKTSLQNALSEIQEKRRKEKNPIDSTLDQIKSTNFGALKNGTVIELGSAPGIFLKENGRFFEVTRAGGARFSPDRPDDLFFLREGLGLNIKQVHQLIAKAKDDNLKFSGKPNGISENASDISISKNTLQSFLEGIKSGSNTQEKSCELAEILKTSDLTQFKNGAPFKGLGGQIEFTHNGHVFELVFRNSRAPRAPISNDYLFENFWVPLGTQIGLQNLEDLQRLRELAIEDNKKVTGSDFGISNSKTSMVISKDSFLTFIQESCDKIKPKTNLTHASQIVHQLSTVGEPLNPPVPPCLKTPTILENPSQNTTIVPINGHGTKTNLTFQLPNNKFIIAPHNLDEGYILSMDSNKGLDDYIKTHKGLPALKVTKVFRDKNTGDLLKEDVSSGEWRLYTPNKAVPDMNIFPWSQSGEFEKWEKNNPALAKEILEKNKSVPDYWVIGNELEKNKIKIFKQTTLSKIVHHTDQKILIPATCNSGKNYEKITINGQAVEAIVEVSVKVDFNNTANISPELSKLFNKDSSISK